MQLHYSILAAISIACLIAALYSEIKHTSIIKTTALVHAKYAVLINSSSLNVKIGKTD